MSCHGGFSVSEATRREWYNPEQILKDVGLQAGDTFADIGCGEGFFSILAAKTVGSSGKVYALDIDEQAIEKLKENARAEDLRNIFATVGAAEELVLCKECADLVFYSMVLHDFNDPAKVLLNARQMIKPKGRLVDLDWKKEGMPFGPNEKIRFSEQQASGLMQNAGFRIQNVTSVGLYHYLVVSNRSL